jgi:hypothetical protein
MRAVRHVIKIPTMTASPILKATTDTTDEGSFWAHQKK